MTDLDGLIGPLEHRVLEALWAAGEPCDVATVRARCNGSRDADAQLAYTTVMTVLSRLHDKGLLTRERVGRGFRYAPVHDADGLVEHLSGREVGRLLDRFGEVALTHFAAALEDAPPHLRARLAGLAGEDDGA